MHKRIYTLEANSPPIHNADLVTVKKVLLKIQKEITNGFATVMMSKIVVMSMAPRPTKEHGSALMMDQMTWIIAKARRGIRSHRGQMRTQACGTRFLTRTRQRRLPA